MDALEALIADGFVPDYDIYLGLATTKRSWAALVLPAPSCPNCSRAAASSWVLRSTSAVALCRRATSWLPDFPSEGYADFEFSMKDPGGHSSQPGEHSSLGIIGKTACILERTFFPSVWRPLLLSR